MRGKKFGSQNIAVRDQHRSFDRVLQLAYISMPLVLHQVTHGFCGNRPDGTFEFCRRLFEEMLGEDGNVFDAMTQRRHAD